MRLSVVETLTPTEEGGGGVNLWGRRGGRLRPESLVTPLSSINATFVSQFTQSAVSAHMTEPCMGETSIKERANWEGRCAELGPASGPG